MKAEGLRGRELAAAIHAEQVARGMKKEKHGAGPRGQGARGKPGGRAKDRDFEGHDDDSGAHDRDDDRDHADDHDEDRGHDDDRGRGGKPKTKGKGKRGGQS